MKFRQKNLGALKKYLKNLEVGKRLLNFAMRVCTLCHSLQISFVFEHPQTARSWQQRSVRQLMARPGIQRVVAHQCQFGLRSKDQNLHKKPTAFLTNHTGLAEQLARRCKGGHLHEPIIGDQRRSAASQVYPDGLVETILQTYARSVGKAPAEVHLCHSDKVIEEDQRRDQLYFLDSELQEIEANLEVRQGSQPTEIMVSEEEPQHDGGLHEDDPSAPAVLKDFLPETYGLTEAHTSADGWNLVNDRLWAQSGSGPSSGQVPLEKLLDQGGWPVEAARR